MLRFIHAADLHLDADYEGLRPREAKELRAEQFALLDAFRDLVLREHPALVFLSGDVFDARNIQIDLLDALWDMLGALPCRVFIAPGNHDPYSDGSPYRRMPNLPRVHVFTQEAIETVRLPELGCTVYGAAFTNRARGISPLEGLPHETEGLRFACVHGEITSRASRYGPLSVEELACSGLHYLALGHVHKRSALARAGDCYYAYPGALQSHGFADEGQGGAFVGTMDESGTVTLEFVPLATRAYCNIVVDVGGKESLDLLRELLHEAQERNIARIFLRGARTGETLPMQELHALAAPGFYSVAIIDETHSATEHAALWAHAQERSLQGACLRALQKQEQNAIDDAQRLRIAQAARYILELGMQKGEGKP